MGREGRESKREDERRCRDVVYAVCYMHQRNDRGMKTLRALGDRLTAVGKEVLIERADLRRANNVSRKHAVFYARFTLQESASLGTKASGYSFKPAFRTVTWGVRG